MLKVFIVGISGKMGKMICNAAQSSDDIEICGGLDAFDGGVFPTFKRAADVNVAADVIIDFSRPETLDEVISLCDKLSCPAVIATTGYDDGQLKKIDELSKRRGVYAGAIGGGGEKGKIENRCGTQRKKLQERERRHRHKLGARRHDCRTARRGVYRRRRNNHSFPHRPVKKNFRFRFTQSRAVYGG